MGILNITPDSFSDGGKYFDFKKAVQRAVEIEQEGADIIDVGGESTRPFSEPITIEEELKRVIPVIKEIRKLTDLPISVDTYKSEVAKKAIEVGADIVNDISGLTFDNNMKKVIKDYKIPVIIMHIKGKPKDMQVSPVYNNLIEDIIGFLENKKKQLNKCGISDDKIIIDPGIGFGKKIKHNYIIINNLKKLKRINLPILIGVSRKSFLGKPFDLETSERLEGTIVATTISFLQGASIFRTHDVSPIKKALETAKFFKEYKK